MPNVQVEPARPDRRRGRDDRRHEGRRADRRPRQLLDRPAALQRPVRRQRLLGDQERQEDAHGHRRHLQRHHHRLLGQPRRHRRQGVGRMFGTGGDAKGQPTQTNASRTARRVSGSGRSWSARHTRKGSLALMRRHVPIAVLTLLLWAVCSAATGGTQAPPRSAASSAAPPQPSVTSSRSSRRSRARTTSASTCARLRRSRITPAARAAARSPTTCSSKFKSWGLDARIEEFEALMPFPTERVRRAASARIAITRQLQEPAVDAGSGLRRRRPASQLQRLLGRRRRHRRSRLRELRHPRGLRAAREAGRRRQGQDRHRPLRPQLARHQAEGRLGARRDRLHHLLRSARRRLLRRGRVSRPARSGPSRACSAAA